MEAAIMTSEPSSDDRAIWKVFVPRTQFELLLIMATAALGGIIGTLLYQWATWMWGMWL